MVSKELYSKVLNIGIKIYFVKGIMHYLAEKVESVLNGNKEYLTICPKMTYHFSHQEQDRKCWAAFTQLVYADQDILVYALV